ncbi:MAG: hypothetical protein C0395_04320 [Gemmatimonas sp.]|nr:hypothetical protein [Gemmatimonas sp.]
MRPGGSTPCAGAWARKKRAARRASPVRPRSGMRWSRPWPPRGWSAAGDRIGPPGADVLPEGLRRAVDAVETRLRVCGLDWPGAAAVAADLPAGLLAGHDLEEHLRYLVARGRAVMVADDYPVHAAALDELRARLRAHFDAEGSLNFATFRELTGLSRKLGIPLLEHLDAAGVTRRVGDLRTIGPVLKKEA